MIRNGINSVSHLINKDKGNSYDLTNAFYVSCDFYVLEVFPTLWDEWNPCQVMVHHLER
jgi:hypothetical protein